jgi:sporulation protein YlmC with PRC-barrel domain
MAKKDRGRCRADAAGVGPYVRKGVRLVRLSELGKYRVADGEPDVRGWEVRTISGRLLGEVDDLLVDAEAGEVVMLDIDVKNGGRHSFAPVRAAMIDQASRLVRLDTGDLRDEELPSLGSTGSGEEDARTFGERYEQAYGDRGWAEDRDYVLPHGDDDVHFARRNAREAAEREAARRATDREVRIERRREIVEAADRESDDEGRVVRYRGREEQKEGRG